MIRLSTLRGSLGAVIGICIALGTSSPAHAQPRRSPEPAAPADPAGDSAEVAKRREKLKKRIRALRNAKLMEELTLDGPTAGRVLSVFDRFDEEFYKLLAKRFELQRGLRHADAMRDPRAIDRLIDETIANQRALGDVDERRLGELRKILTPAQVAKLMIVLPEFERRIQNQLRTASNQRHGGAAGAGRAGTGGPVDSDDDLEPDELDPPKPQRPQPRRREAPRSTPSSAPGNTPPCDPSQPCR